MEKKGGKKPSKKINVDVELVKKKNTDYCLKLLLAQPKIQWGDDRKQHSAMSCFSHTMAKVSILPKCGNLDPWPNPAGFSSEFPSSPVFGLEGGDNLEGRVT